MNTRISAFRLTSLFAATVLVAACSSQTAPVVTPSAAASVTPAATASATIAPASTGPTATPAPQTSAGILRVLESGTNSADPSSGSFVAKNSVAWQAAHMKAAPSATLPTVDFSTEMVLCLWLGERKTAGYTVTIDSVAVKNNKLTATYSEHVPPAGSVVAQDITHPFVFVAVPKSDLEVVFETGATTTTSP